MLSTTSLTRLEKIVFNAVVSEATFDECGDVCSIAEVTNLSVESVKGVLGSLTKKNMVHCDSEDSNGVYPIISGNVECYLNDNFADSDIQLITFEIEE